MTTPPASGETTPAWPWLVAGQARDCSLADTLAAAKSVASAAGITRLADITGLDPVGVPVFQATRPRARCLSVATGKGLTPRAAMVSALLEGIEADVAERIRPSGPPCSLQALDAETIRVWHEAPRGPLAIHLNPDQPRTWLSGHDLQTGTECLLPFDLVSLDFSREPLPDALPSTIGLATGNSREEALMAALGELLEHDLEASWNEQSSRTQRQCEVDLASIDDPLVQATLRRITAAGRRARLWSMGQDWGIAAFHCIISDEPDSDTALPPAGGTGCHPHRTVAALRAILEAAQTRTTLISGARDDLTAATYADQRTRMVQMVLGLLSFGPGPLDWSQVPCQPSLQPEAALADLRCVAAARSALPVLAIELAQPHPALHVVKLLAPGLLHADRRCKPPKSPTASAPVVTARRSPRRILFAGPTLAGERIPSDIEVHPPAMAGDLARLLADPPQAIGLVDGCFETGPSVWHKEILDLLAHGVAVFGAASLGALRAAELHGFGMLGIGTIFAAYREGMIRRDDAVMVAHAPAELGHAPLTLSLVDAEAAFYATAMPIGERRALQRIARTLPFRERSWRAIFHTFSVRYGRLPFAREPDLAAAPSLKRRDALLLIDTLRGEVPPLAPIERPPLTCFYQALLERV